MALLTAALGQFVLNRVPGASKHKGTHRTASTASSSSSSSSSEGYGHTTVSIAALPQSGAVSPKPTQHNVTAQPPTPSGLFCVSDTGPSNPITSILSKYTADYRLNRTTAAAENDSTTTAVPPVSAHTSNSTTTAVPPVSAHTSNSTSVRPARTAPPTRDSLYLYDYGRGWGPKLTYSVGVAYGTGMLVGIIYGTLLGALHTPYLSAHRTGSTSAGSTSAGSTTGSRKSRRLYRSAKVDRRPVMYRWSRSNNSQCTGRSGGTSGRVLVNSMLNSASANGAALGNKLGALTILYCSLRSVLSIATPLHDAWSVPVAGMLSGSLQSCHTGWRMMLRHGVLGSAAFTVLDHSMKRSMAKAAQQQMHYY